MARGKNSLWGYLKSAFLQHWNLLVFLGAATAAAISPMPEVAVPLVAAAEIMYLTSMVGNDKFRRAMDAESHARQRTKHSAANSAQAPSLDALVLGLDRQRRRRFEELHRRCHEMQAIAHGVGGRAAGRDNAADRMQESGLDRLLWVFLRLLHSQNALDKFLASTDERAIETQLEQVRAKLADAEAHGRERLTHSLRDSLATSELRLDNYTKAQKNAEFVEVELDRIEGKIQTLSEMAVNRQDPDFISREVDSVAESFQHTERAISELRLVDGLIDDLTEPPPILSTDLSRVLDEA